MSFVVFSSGGFGTSGLKVANLELGSVAPKLRNLQSLCGLRAHRFVQFEDLVLSYRSKIAMMIKCRSSKSAIGPDCEY